MAYRMRSGSGSKKQLKGKVVQIYESFLKGEDMTKGNPNFWDELFLLKPKISQLEAEIVKLTYTELLNAQANIRELVCHCVENLAHEHHIRVVYALQTLCCIVDSFGKKLEHRRCIEFIIHNKRMEEIMTPFLQHMTQFLNGEYPDSFKSLCLKLLLLFITASDNLNHNSMVAFMMRTSIFDPLIQLLKVSSSRIQHGHDAVIILTLLASYQRLNGNNPYCVRLSLLDDELALNGYSQVITLSLTELCRHFFPNQGEPQNAGWLSSITNIVGNMFVSEDGVMKIQQVKAKNPLLMALYEAVHFNRNFITVLGHTQTDSSAPPSPSNTLNSSSPTPDLSHPPVIDVTNHPSNLFATFFQYCSIAMQDTKLDICFYHVKLCFLILTCISEDQYANSLMHDVNLVFKVQLRRLPMRHRKLAPDKLAPSQPFASTLLDLMVEFIMSHMMKRLPLELYLLSVGIIHRLLCFQKRCRVRLNYQWKELWTALIIFLKYLLANENHLARRMDIFMLAHRIINIFNLFITYGDTFLPSASSYDELYYEIIRMHQVFDNLYSMGLRYSSVGGDYHESAMKMTNSLVNIRAIINHFSPRIESWLTSQSLSTPSEEQILEVVRKNYDSLTLRLQDSLDQFERYSENPDQAQFFSTLMFELIHEIRDNVNYAAVDVKAILQDFSVES